MKIVCDKCGGVVAHLIGNRLVEVVRQGHKLSVVGTNYTVMASCPNTGKCNNKVAITVENGKVLLDNLKRKENKDGEKKKKKSKSKSSGKSGEGKDDERKKKKRKKHFKKAKGNKGKGSNGNGGKGNKIRRPDGKKKPVSRKYTRI